jgi:hypothetical protein
MIIGERVILEIGQVRSATGRVCDTCVGQVGVDGKWTDESWSKRVRVGASFCNSSASEAAESTVVDFFGKGDLVILRFTNGGGEIDQDERAEFYKALIQAANTRLG